MSLMLDGIGDLEKNIEEKLMGLYLFIAKWDEEDLEKLRKDKYRENFDEYKSQIKSIASSLLEKKKKGIIKVGEELYKENERIPDMRIPNNYRKFKRILEEVYSEITYKYKELSQEEGQDMRNIMAYLMYGEKEILPPRETHIVDISDPIWYVLNKRKLRPSYWEEKRVTRIMIIFSERYFGIVRDPDKAITVEKSDIPKKVYFSGNFVLLTDPFKLERDICQEKLEDYGLSGILKKLKSGVKRIF